MLIFYFSPWIRGFSSPACNCSAGCDSVGFPGTICWLSHSQRPKPEQREHWESRMVVMWKLDRKRCLREMVSVSRCHRDLFLFLWGFTLVTKLLSGSSPTPHPAPKRWKHSAFVMETALCARLFFCSDLDLGLRFEIVKGVILWSSGERKRCKAYDGRVIKTYFRVYFSKVSPATLSPGATTWRAHEQWGPQASVQWEMQEVQALDMLFKATFWN